MIHITTVYEMFHNYDKSLKMMSRAGGMSHLWMESVLFYFIISIYIDLFLFVIFFLFFGYHWKRFRLSYFPNSECLSSIIGRRMKEKEWDYWTTKQYIHCNHRHWHTHTHTPIFFSIFQLSFTETKQRHQKRNHTTFLYCIFNIWK